MNMQRSIRNAALATGILASALLVDGWLPIGVAIKDAEARVGRPATPASFAGLARRTIRRTSVYAATLPRGCRTVIIDGTRLHQCGGTYYQGAGNRYVVVRVD
jgi:hypothetical protein